MREISSDSPCGKEEISPLEIELLYVYLFHPDNRQDLCVISQLKAREPGHYAGE
jgi:hypothetical protein